MPGETLHLCDLDLCDHALDNIRCHTRRPAFAAYAEEQLSPAIWKHLQALTAHNDPAP